MIITNIGPGTAVNFVLSPAYPVNLTTENLTAIRAVVGTARGNIAISHSPPLPAWLSVFTEQDQEIIIWTGTRGDAVRQYTGVATITRIGYSAGIQVSATLF